MSAWWEPALEAGWIPDPLIRAGIRRILRARIREQEAGGPDAQRARKAAFIEALRRSPIALRPDAANHQHYDVPPAFFEHVLGPHLKYSAGLWSGGAATLAEAEEAMLALTMARADLDDGQHILELGCGWGSLTLAMTARFPRARIVAVSNSPSQRAFIAARLRARQLTNVTVVTADMNDVDLAALGRFDRVVSVEMFEHMRNYARLLEAIDGCLAPDGRLFVHLFSHARFAYPYEVRGASDWMAAHFFTGGTMPSDDLLAAFDDHLVIERQWTVNGRDYAKTAEAWLAAMDRARAPIDAVLAATYGGASTRAADVRRWRARWRVFFMACAELFAFRGGDEWHVSHYLLRKRASHA